jgi:hypothetical protein
VTATLDTRPRRLVLSPAELELLRRHAGMTLPQDFQVQTDPGAEMAARNALTAAVASLAERGVVQPDPSGEPEACTVHPSALANLGVLASPQVLVRTRAWHRSTRIRGPRAGRVARRRAGRLRRPGSGALTVRPGVLGP